MLIKFFVRTSQVLDIDRLWTSIEAARDNLQNSKECGIDVRPDGGLACFLIVFFVANLKKGATEAQGTELP